MINISNYTSKDNPEWLDLRLVRPAATTGAPARAAARSRSAAGRLGHIVLIGAAVMLSWPAAIARRLGDRWFAMNDTEAYWRGWQIIKVHGGLGRRYRDLRFDTLAACAQCDGAGVTSDAPCIRCLGAGRVTIGEAG